MTLHEVSEQAGRVIDLISFALAGVAVFSLAQAALVVSILAGLASFLLAAIRIYDRLVFGRSND